MTERTLHDRVVLIILIIILCVVGIDRSFAAQKLSKAHVHQVHDGDTVTLRLNGKKYRTRLIGIDAPEMGQQPWGRRAKGRLIKIMRQTGWTVFVETDGERLDKYGRLLAYLWTKKKKLINEQMIVDGYAVLFTISPNLKYSERLARAESEAKREEKGIWGPDGLEEAPLEYRTKHPRK